jgi:hypothetical protein
MINNSTNINKMNNHLLPQIIEHKKKKTTTYTRIKIYYSKIRCDVLIIKKHLLKI